MLTRLNINSSSSSSGLPPKKFLSGRRQFSLWHRWLFNWASVGFVVVWAYNYMGALYFHKDTFFSKAAVTLEPASTFVPTLVPTLTLTPTLIPTLTPTLAPTLTPIPTYTPTPASSLFTLGYSYYYPPLGGANCHTDNWIDGRCRDITASGLPWSAYIGKGIALGLPFISRYGYVCADVLAPESLAGHYRIIDLCPACGDTWVDFLDSTQKLSWGSPVVLSIVDCSE